MKIVRATIPVVLCLMMSAVAYDDATKEVTEETSNLLKERILIVRGFPTESEIEFNSDLKPITSITPGSSMASALFIKKVSSHQNDLKIEGEYLPYVQGSLHPSRKFSIVIHGPFTGDPRTVAQFIRESVFITSKEELNATAPVVPAAGAKSPDQEVVGKTAEGAPIYKVKSGLITPPKLLYSPNPKYPEEARQAKYQGKVVLAVIIGLDGRVDTAQIARYVGMGLDQKALEAVQHWRFEPAIKDGKPVRCAVNIEVSFNLY